MSQLSLFDSDEIVVVDEERGRVVYTPRFVDAATAARWFDELQRNVDWRGQRRMMDDREVDVPAAAWQFLSRSGTGVGAARHPRSAGSAARRLGVVFTAV